MIFVALLALLLVSCSPATPPQQQQPVPMRIISVVPAATEMLFAMGVGERVIAVGDYDNFPPEVSRLPRVGGLLNPNMERIIELKPDFVIAYGSRDSIGPRLDRLGIRLHPFAHGNVEETLQYMLELGRTVHAEAGAEQVIARIRGAFEEVRAQAPARPPKVLLVHSRQVGTLGPLYSVGASAFQHDLIAIAGGSNIFGDVQREAIQPSLEEIISRAPDIIVETLPSLESDQADARRQDWSKLKIPAVLNNRIHIVADDVMIVPGARLDTAVRIFGGIIREIR
jgi:iron complex transport system substrate-binding protein